jgi:UDP-N-acetylglucosamine 2-epimerase (non-hydrolysing)
MKIINVVGARPNFMKIAPIMKAMRKYKDIQAVLVHTGQHYDDNMSTIFFKDLGLPTPDIYLGVGSTSHAQQTAKIMVEFEEIILSQKPDMVLVVGDVNSTLACALTAVKMNIPIGHVEAGLRSFDRTMPEEINRILTDSISDYLFTTCKDANENLIKEGISKDKIYFVGNTMVDSLLQNKVKAKNSNIFKTFNNGINENSEYGLLTLHRPSNVDDNISFSRIILALKKITKKIKIIFPCHPRTKKQIERLGLSKNIMNLSGLFIIEPTSYLDFMKLMMHAKVVLTDSGGIQEETTALGIPCLTLRKNTERPITVTQGTNLIVGDSLKEITTIIDTILNGKSKRGKTLQLWDGKTAERIVEIISKKQCGEHYK